MRIVRRSPEYSAKFKLRRSMTHRLTCSVRREIAATASVYPCLPAIRVQLKPADLVEALPAMPEAAARAGRKRPRRLLRRTGQCGLDRRLRAVADRLGALPPSFRGGCCRPEGQPFPGEAGAERLDG